MFQFDTLFDHVPVGVYVVDAGLRLRHANPIAHRLFRDPALVGKKFHELIHAIRPRHHADDILARFRHTLASGEPYFSPELNDERPEPEPAQTLEWNISRILLSDGQQGVLCYFRDVSKRLASKARLVQSEWRYHQLFSSIDQGYCVIEVLFDEQDKPVDYRILEVNEAFEQQTGLRNATGRRILELAPGHEAHWFEIYGKVAQTGEPVRAINRADDRWFDLYAFRLGGSDSRKVAVLFSNITDRVRSETALKESEERFRALFNTMQALHRQKDEFLAMLSHELRNPLAALWNAAQVLRLKGLEDPRQQQACGIVERQVGNLKHLVDELLEVSRLTTGRIRLSREAIAVADIVKRAVETTEPLITARRHELTVSLPKSAAWVEGDAGRLEQVVINLMTNAAKYTPEGGRIWLTVVQEEGAILLCVRDTGVGIGEELLPHVFELFTQADRSLDRSEGGLGIGLSLVQRLVELHGGQVTVRSQVGEGSEFVVRLPAIAAPIGSASVLPAIQQAPKVDRKKACKVLVVDDNVDGAQVLTILLAASGHEARTAHDGPSALDAAHDFLPDVVLLDIGLPGLDGYEVAKRMRKHPALQDVMLVAMTGYGQDSDRQRAEEAGLDHHLVKPADFNEVEKLLATVA